MRNNQKQYGSAGRFMIETQPNRGDREQAGCLYMPVKTDNKSYAARMEAVRRFREIREQIESL